MTSLTTFVLPPSLGEEHPGRVAFWRFRHEHYSKRLGFEPLNENELEMDEHEPASTTITVVEAGDVVAGCRLISSYTAANPLPIEFKYRGAIERPTYEISRTIIDPQKSCRELSAILYREIFKALAEQKIEAAYAVVEPKYLRVLQHFYSPRAFIALGEPREISTPGGKRLTHLPMQICMEEWALCWLRPAHVGADAKRHSTFENASALSPWQVQRPTNHAVA